MDGSANTQDPGRDPEPFRSGLWFEDFEVGQVIWSHGRTVTEADIVLFAGLSGDYTGLHTDEERARRTPFRGRIAHGMLIWSVASGLGAQTGIFDGTIDALAGMEMDFAAPVYPGDTIRLRMEVTSKEEKSGRNGRVLFKATVFNQKDVMVVDGEWRTLVRRDRTRRKQEAEA